MCWYGEILCPVIAGEPLSYCAGACYSKFMYTCTDNVLALLPAVDTPFTLSVDNPAVPVLHGKPVTAGAGHWVLGGQTSSYCPSEVGDACPPGNETVIVASNALSTAAMSVVVPGGQQAYLTANGYMAYTQAHSTYIPPGSVTTGFAAYLGGGFVNLNGNGRGWVACPPRASGGGGTAWNLVAKYDTDPDRFKDCTAINLKVNPLPSGTFGAWQYT